MSYGTFSGGAKVVQLKNPLKRNVSMGYGTFAGGARWCKGSAIILYPLISFQIHRFYHGQMRLFSSWLFPFFSQHHESNYQENGL